MSSMKTIICSIGGGYSSTVKMPEILLQKHNADEVHFVNCVLPNEHKSTWQLIDSVSRKLGFEVTHIAFDPDAENKWRYVENRTDTNQLYAPFDIFDLVDFVGNTRIDPCSRMLKRETIKNYIDTVYSPNNCVIAVGIHSDEIERAIEIKRNWTNNGYDVVFPLEDVEKLDTQQEIDYMLNEYGVDMEMYRLGFEHNNCHGACVKAGQKQWAMVYLYFPHVFAEWESREQTWIENHEGKAYPFLRKTVNGEQGYMTLKQFRKYIEKSLKNKTGNFITRFIDRLPSNPACMWCSAI